MKRERMRAIGGGSKPSDETLMLRRQVLIYIRDHGPCKTPDITDALQHPYVRLKPVLYWLRCLGMTSYYGGMWEFVRMNPEVKPLSESVSVVKNEAWHMPQPVTMRKDGVKYTYQAAPVSRWQVDVAPGRGVISGDNPGLARLAQ